MLETCRGIQYIYYKTRICALSLSVTKTGTELFEKRLSIFLPVQPSKIIGRYSDPSRVCVPNVIIVEVVGWKNSPEVNKINIAKA